jgi:ABC-type dipeptide/oligopeptide/nickel transport system ATPase subunit
MLLEATQIGKRYYGRRDWVFKGLDIAVKKGESVAVFGDSGCGKSTLGQALTGFTKLTAGDVVLNGERLRFPLRKDQRRRMQMLFQHPEASFDPRMRLIHSMREPSRFFPGCVTDGFSRSGLCAYLEPYGLYGEHLDRYPAELSGGELQRLALARAMMLQPDFVVLDESTSMLDVISQAQIIALLRELQERTSVAYLFITHDMRLCKLFCERILLLKDGRLMSAQPD